MAKKKFRSDKDTKDTREEGRSQDKRSSSRTNSRNRNNNKVGKTTTGSNSVWMGIGQLAIDATNISTNNATGAPNPAISKDSFGTRRYAPSGIMRLDYVPYFGNFDSPIDPINVAAKQMYDIINSKNSRNPSYDPNDIMIYTIAVAQAWGLHAYVRRICGMYNTFTPMNRYWWRPLAESMGLDPESVQNDITKWRNVANLMALNLNRLAVPSNIPYFKHVYDMCSYIYADAESAKASLFYYSPSAFLRYRYSTLEADEGLGMLENYPTPWADISIDAPFPVTPDKIETYFNDLVWHLFNDTDINTMASDIIKAYGIDNCFVLPMIDETYRVEPMYDPAVNLVTKNTRVSLTLGSNDVDADYSIHQEMNRNVLKADFPFDYFEQDDPDSAIIVTDLTDDTRIPLDFPFDNPSNEAVMLATRQIWYATKNMSGNERIQGCTDVVIGVTCFTFEDTLDGWKLVAHINPVYTNVSGSGASSVDAAIAQMAAITKFKSAPMNYIIFRGTSADGYFKAPRTMSLVSDVTNFTTITTEEVERMNRAAIFSVFLPTGRFKSGSNDR